MHCRVCESLLTPGEAECPECGHIDVVATSARPSSVANAARILALSPALSLTFVLMHAERLPRGVLYAAAAWFAVVGGFIAAIWHGISWVRTVYLVVVGLYAAGIVWRLMLFFAFGFFLTAATEIGALVWTELGVFFCVAWLLLRPESCAWFRR